MYCRIEYTTNTIDMPMDRAKDTASIKSDTKRVEEIMNENRNTTAGEHGALVVLLYSIQDYVYNID